MKKFFWSATILFLLVAPRIAFAQRHNWPSADSSAAKTFAATLCTPEKFAERKAERAKALLLKFFPDDPAARAIEIQICEEFVGDKLPNASADISGRRIYLTSGMLKMARNKDELGFFLAHEFGGHIKLRHVSTKIRKGWFRFRVGDDFELLEKQEVAADFSAARAFEKVGTDICKAIPVLERGLIAFDVYSDPTDPYNKIMIKRLGLLKVYCYNRGKLELIDPLRN